MTQNTQYSHTNTMSSNTQSPKKKATNDFVNTDSKKKYSKKRKTPVQIKLEKLRKSKEFRDLGDAFDYFD